MTSKNIFWSDSTVQKQTREQQLDQKGCVVWLTGLSGSGKSTLARGLEAALTERRKLAYVLDGDNVRHGLNRDLGFSAADREENIRRVGEVARLFFEQGNITLCTFVSPYQNDRDRARNLLPEGRFFEVHVDCPVEVCKERDPKGLYEKAEAGEILNFTGISAPYEEPESPEVVVRTHEEDVDTCVDRIIEAMEEKGILG